MSTKNTGDSDENTNKKSNTLRPTKRPIQLLLLQYKVKSMEANYIRTIPRLLQSRLR